MAYTTASHIDHDGIVSRAAKGASEFVGAWIEATPAYAVYKALVADAPSAGSTTIARSALDLPTLMRE